MKFSTIKQQALLLLAVCSLQALWAQGPNNTGTYYQSADKSKGRNLKTALSKIIANPRVLSYGELWDAFKKTDLMPDGTIRDRYSSITHFDPDRDRAGSYRNEGDVFNREHSFPKSWFNDATPMYSDLYHLYPTDGKVNGMRSNYPFGENNGEKYKSKNGYSKLGQSTTPGYSGIVFEPNDEWKGDFARTYFYMVTCYESRLGSWHSDMIDNSAYPALASWALKMLIKWAQNDPVSDIEKARNEAVAQLQGNRNPYIDYPGLEQWVWGDSVNVAFSYDHFVYHYNGGGGTQPDDPTIDPDDPVINPDNPKGEQTYKLVASNSELKAGYGYLMVYETGNVAMAGTEGKSRTYADVTVNNGTIVTEVNTANKPRQLTLAMKDGNYTWYDGVEKGYLALTSSDNAMHLATSDAEKTAQWTIDITDGVATVSNARYADRYVQYNEGSPRFACYKSSSNQKYIALYINGVLTGVKELQADTDTYVNVYRLDGTLVRQKVLRNNAVVGLAKGIYIVGGKKVVVW